MAENTDDRAAAERSYAQAAARMKVTTAGLAALLGPDEAARLLTTCAVGLLMAAHGRDGASACLRRWSEEVLAEDVDGRPH